MEQILKLYARPYDPENPTVCYDEHPYQLLSDVWESMPMEPGKPKRVDYEYKREDTCNVFIFYEPLTGWRRVLIRDTRKRLDFAECMKILADEWFPEAYQVHVVLDQLNTHTPGSFYKAFAPCEAERLTEKLKFHYTPTHGSWLNMAEIEIGVLCEQCLAERIPDEDTLCREIAAWEMARNEQCATVNWQFTTIDARNKLKRLYPVISKSS